MSYIAYNAERFIRNPFQRVGNGQCAVFVEVAAHTPLTRSWKQGAKVKGNLLLRKGTAIATFQNKKYQNRTNGDSHAAIYLKQDAVGIYVIDQWRGQGVHQRQIKFKQGTDKPRNDGDQYFVIE